MNFQALEGLIQSIISQYTCGGCKSKITKKDVHIQSIEGNSILVEIECPQCELKALIKSEVVSMDLSKMLTKKQLTEIQKAIRGNKQEESIKDEQIIELNKTLKKTNFEVLDLFI